MEAGCLTCPQCGAAVSEGATRCAYCDAQLQTIACPSCLGMIFVGAKHCSHCGARAMSASPPLSGPRACPCCRLAMTPTAIGSLLLDECGTCGGQWLDPISFEQVCRDRATDAAAYVAGTPLAAPAAQSTPASSPPPARRPFYVRCAVCSNVMNRISFSGTSGIIVDVCKGHGTWFDRDELRRVVEFIRSGGLMRALEKEREKLERDRAKLAEGRAISLQLSARHVAVGSEGLLELFGFLFG